MRRPFLAGYIWGTISRAQVHSCTKIITRGSQSSLWRERPFGSSFSEVLGCERSQSDQTGAGCECVVGRGGSRGGEGCTIRRKKNQRRVLQRGDALYSVLWKSAIISSWINGYNF